MDKLFTPLGEDWKRLWYPSRSRYCRYMDSDAHSRSKFTVIDELDRVREIAQYFLNIKAQFAAQGHSKDRPYVSNGISCRSFTDLLNNSKALYTYEVGEPNEELVPFLTKKRILKCLRYLEHEDLLDSIGYAHLFDCDVNVAPKGEPPLMREYEYPVYRVDGSLKVINWILKKLEEGIPLESLHYCQYHGDSYPGQYLVERHQMELARTRTLVYREEVRIRLSMNTIKPKPPKPIKLPSWVLDG